MSDSKPRPKQAIPSYIGWRGEMLARLALSRMAGWTITEQPIDGRFDYSVITEDGVAFLIEVKAGSSLHHQLKGMGNAEVVRYALSKTALLAAARVKIPVVLFVFDADTEFGRYLLLRGIKLEPGGSHFQTVLLPKANLISEESLQRMVEELAG
jgi:hypothetical protein